MRVALAIAVLLGAGIAVVVLLDKGDENPSGGPTPTVVDSGPAPSAQAPTPAPPADSAEAELPQAIGGRVVKFPSRTPRPGERPDAYETRQLIFERWEKFLASAAPTREQEESIISILADAQENCGATEKEVRTEADRLLYEEGKPDAREASIPHWRLAMVQDTHARIKEVLTPEQQPKFRKQLYPMISLICHTRFFDIERATAGVDAL